MPCVLGIDPGNYCGFGIVNDAGLVASGVWHLLGEKGEATGRRFARLFYRLADLDTEPDFVAFETKFAIPGASTRNLLNTGGYIGVIQTWCVHHQLPEPTALAPSSLKKRATGNGRAEKADMCAEACRLTGKDIRDDNEADAVCLAFVIHEELTTR